MKIYNLEKGITLIVLVITIILLLILAGITISQLTRNELFEKAKLAKEKSENAQKIQNTTLADYENEIGKYVDGMREENNTKKIVLFSGTATSTNVEYELTDSINNYSFLLVSAGNVKNIETTGINQIGTLLIDTSDIDYETNIKNEQNFIVDTYLEHGYYGIRFGFISDKKFVIDNIVKGTSWGNDIQGIYKIIGIK